MGYYIKDPNILNLIKKYLKVGVLEDGIYQTNEAGSAQGNIISSVLANIYMHHVLVLWYKKYFEKQGTGENFLLVYADDYLAGFEEKSERCFMFRRNPDIPQPESPLLLISENGKWYV